MTIIKLCSDLQQSKKLAEILPLESADMYRVFENNAETRVYYGKMPTAYFVCKPCWSLASLLAVLPDYTLQTNNDGTVFVVCDSKKPMISDTYDNPVDACVDMIIKLSGLKML